MGCAALGRELGPLHLGLLPQWLVASTQTTNHKHCKHCSENGLPGVVAACERIGFLGQSGREGHIRTRQRAVFNRTRGVSCLSKSQKAPGQLKRVQESSKLLPGLLALHHRVIGRRRLHGPGWGGGREGQLRLRHPADGVLGHLPTDSIQPPAEWKPK